MAGNKATLGVADATTKIESALIADFQTIAKFVVPAKQFLTAGNGAIVGGVDDRGILYAKLQTSLPAEITGTHRFVYTDANEYRKVVIIEVPSGLVNTTKTLMTQGFKLARNKNRIGQDAKILWEFKPDAVATISWPNSELQLPVVREY